MVKLIFGKSARPISMLVRLITRSNWSHVGFLVGDKVIESAFTRGVGQTPLDEYTQRYKEIGYGYLDVSKSKFKGFCKSQLGKPYDWMSVFKLNSERDYTNTDSWECQDLLIAAAIHADKKFLKGVQNAKMTPDHLYYLCIKKGSVDSD